MRVEQGAQQCEVVYPADAPDAQRLRLDLAPPCHVVVWRETPQRRPSAEGQSDGEPVGLLGEPEAWHYRSANNATVIAVIGDPVPQALHDDVHADRVARGYHCGGSLQGVLFRRDRIALGVKRANVGETCVEVGMDEKGFWLLAH